MLSKTYLIAIALAALCASLAVPPRCSANSCSANNRNEEMGAGRPPPAHLPVFTTEQANALSRRVQAGGADARADAAAAAGRGEFGMILTGNRTTRPIGLVCFTPYGYPPHVLAAVPHGDVFDEAVDRWHAYARTYNQTLVDHAEYPDRDLCRRVTEGEERSGFEPMPDRDARPVTDPVRTLHQAARRGRRAELERLLADTDVNALDSLGMTPVAWAVARGNGPAVDVLLAAGANPWLGNGGYRTGGVYWAAALGRRALFEQLVRSRGRPFERWPALYQAAAVSSSQVAIVEHMVAEPHEPFRLELVNARPLPGPEAFAPVLRGNPSLADALLTRAADYGPRADLVRVALANGADPNAKGSYETTLGTAAKGIGEDSVAIVDLLLRAGADPNRVSHRTRPVWYAVTSMRIDLERGEWTARARAIFLRLVAAGADLRLPNDEGRPPISFVLFPTRWDHWELDAGVPTELLELLVTHGVDVNATWQGRRVLSAVEAQAGADSELAKTMRRLGARR